jgi:hypothetical protein
MDGRGLDKDTVSLEGRAWEQGLTSSGVKTVFIDCHSPSISHPGFCSNAGNPHQYQYRYFLRSANVNIKNGLS